MFALFLILHTFIICCFTAKLYLTLRDLMDCVLPGPSVHGIPQARVLEWVAIPFSRGSPRDRTSASCIAGRFFTTEPPGKPKGSDSPGLTLLSFCSLNHYSFPASPLSSTLDDNSFLRRLPSGGIAALNIGIRHRCRAIVTVSEAGVTLCP